MLRNNFSRAKHNVQFTEPDEKLEEQRICLTLVFGWTGVRVFSWSLMPPLLEWRNVRVLLDKARGHTLYKERLKIRIKHGAGLLQELTGCN
jgi:hypothetical protein